MKNKILYLGIKHFHQIKTPSSQELLNNPAFEEEIKESFKQFKNKGDVKKILKKIAKQHQRKIVTEQIFLTDNLSPKQADEASLIIDINNKELIKNRYLDDKPEKIIELYIDRYKDKINEFRAIF